MSEPSEIPEGAQAPVVENCPACGAAIDMSGVPPFSDVSCPSCGHTFTARVDFNHFRILEMLGQGGMGAVYRAVDTNLDRGVALKVLRLALGGDSDECEKLAREARTTAAVDHPNVVKVYDFGSAQGQFYIAMEMIAGGSLDDLMQRDGLVDEATVLEVGIQVAQGLEAALEKDLIHRDIKPANILFTESGVAKLVDFGLAIVMSEEAQSRGEIWGTPYYIAPEKLDDYPEDFRSDMYSLGGTMFHALAGRPPYEADTASLVALKQLKSKPVSLLAYAPHVSTETAYVVNRMMAKNPDQRYASHAELVEHLRFALEKARERGTETGETPKTVPVLDSRVLPSWAVLAIAGTVLALIGILAWVLLGRLAQKDEFSVFPLGNPLQQERLEVADGDPLLLHRVPVA
jgi:serine/threonine protein kinase